MNVAAISTTRDSPAIPPHFSTRSTRPLGVSGCFGLPFRPVLPLFPFVPVRAELLVLPDVLGRREVGRFPAPSDLRLPTNLRLHDLGVRGSALRRTPGARFTRVRKRPQWPIFPGPFTVRP